jgi:hypothetical protein
MNANITQSGSFMVSATEDTFDLTVSGAVGVSTSKKSGSTGLAGAVTVNLIDNWTEAGISGSEVNSLGDVTIKAKDDSHITSVAAGIGVGSAEAGNGVAGSVAVNSIESDVFAYIDDHSVVAGAEDVLVSAQVIPTVVTVAGAIAYGGKNGVGASATINLIDTSAKAYIHNSDLTASGNVSVLANTQVDILAVAGTAGIGNKGMAIAASASVNVVDTETESYISSKHTNGLIVTGSVLVAASDTSSFLLVAGNVALSMKGKAAVGAAATILLHDSQTLAYIDDAA